MVVSRGLDLSLCEWGDVSSARLVLVGAHGFLDCAEFFVPLVTAPPGRCANLVLAAESFAGHGRSAWADGRGRLQRVGTDPARVVSEDGVLNRPWLTAVRSHRWRTPPHTRRTLGTGCPG